MSEPWEQQRKEPANAYAAFKAYHQLGPERSLAKVRRLIGEGSVEGVSPKSQRWIETWSPRWDWVERARAWDGHLEAIRQRAIEASVVAAEEMLREAAPEMVQQLLDIASGKKVLASARVAAARDLLDRAKVGKRTQEGKVVSTSELGEALLKVLGVGFEEDRPDGEA